MYIIYKESTFKKNFFCGERGKGVSRVSEYSLRRIQILKKKNLFFFFFIFLWCGGGGGGGGGGLEQVISFTKNPNLKIFSLLKIQIKQFFFFFFLGGGGGRGGIRGEGGGGVGGARVSEFFLLCIHI